MNTSLLDLLRKKFAQIFCYKQSLYTCKVKRKREVDVFTEKTEFYDLDEERVYKAIENGVYNAVWKIATNATSAPCCEFYNHIKKGVSEAIEKVACNCPRKLDSSNEPGDNSH